MTWGELTKSFVRLKMWQLKLLLFCVCVVIVMYSVEYDVCDVTKRNQTQFRNIAYSNRPDRVYSSVGRALGQYSKRRRFDSHRGRHIVQACPVWIYTQSNFTNMKLLPCGFNAFSYLCRTDQIYFRIYSFENAVACGC